VQVEVQEEVQIEMEEVQGVQGVQQQQQVEVEVVESMDVESSLVPTPTAAASAVPIRDVFNLVLNDEDRVVSEYVPVVEIDGVAYEGDSVRQLLKTADYLERFQIGVYRDNYDPSALAVIVRPYSTGIVVVFEGYVGKMKIGSVRLVSKSHERDTLYSAYINYQSAEDTAEGSCCVHLGRGLEQGRKLTLRTVRFRVPGYGVYLENIHERS
jgi:hypothetical protein